MRAWLLAAFLAAPAGAAIIEVAPPVWNASPAPALRVGALALPALSDPARALAPSLSLSPVALTPILAAPAIPTDRPVPVAAVAEPERARAEPPTAQDQAKALVASLLARHGEDEPLDAAFDGATEETGATVLTRKGQYTLTEARVAQEGELTTRYERWTGADGRTLWVRRREGPGRWEVAEWGGRYAPRGFAKDGLPLPPSYYADFELSNGRMSSNIETKSETGAVSAMVDAKRSFEAALERFGSAVTGIKGAWVYGDNLAEFNRLTALGATPEEAALATWTGQRAAAAGFTKVVFSDEIKARLAAEKPGAYEAMSALFVRP
ncbi:MAG: hypothetical protein M0D55_09800 [Elusimicrobiota bacterium]|nr:MAG: hypothetical protein M0D55_09800 [Elusimicrobiota bacterium]